MIVITLMTILAPRLILNLRREYYSDPRKRKHDVSTSVGLDLTWDVAIPASTQQDDTQVLGVGVWSAEIGGYVTSRRSTAEAVQMEEE